MHKAMAVLFRPITLKRKDKYLIEDYESAEKYDLKCMPLDVVFGSLVFLSFKERIAETYPELFENQTEIKISQKLMDSLKNGVGTVPFMDLQKVTF